MIQLKFLGTGTSTGVPAMRCRCAVCQSKDPRDKRMRASALIREGDSGPWILIDCGPDLRMQLLREDSPDLAATVLTHTHYDHVGGIDDLRPYAFAMPDHHFPVYCREDVARDLRSRVPYCFEKHPYPGVPTFDIHIIDPEKDFFVPVGHKKVRITPLPVLHGKLPIVGFRCGSLAYITDCSTMPEDTLAKIRGVDILVINALRHTHHNTHQNLLEALDVIKEARPREAYLIHMSHEMGFHAEEDAKLPEGVHLAYDGLEIETQ